MKDLQLTSEYSKQAYGSPVMCYIFEMLLSTYTYFPTGNWKE